MDSDKLIPHLFRTEYSKIVAVLCKHFGIDKLDMAEDIASETFKLALESWPHQGIPENPTAWLYAVTKNKANNYLKRKEIFNDKVEPKLISLKSIVEKEIELTEENISDSQLRMLFTVCHPSISVESQISLALRVLCGFGIEEIADALLTSKSTVNKRLTRAKEKLRSENISPQEPSIGEIKKRRSQVLVSLYLLFCEGYYAENKSDNLQNDACLEAIRLTHILRENKLTAAPEVSALLALMYFLSANSDSGSNSFGQTDLFSNSHSEKWNFELKSQGAKYLHESATGNVKSKYHLEAAIAYWNSTSDEIADKWPTILRLYDELIELNESPIIKLNRLFALSKVKGNNLAIAEAELLNMNQNSFYLTLMGYLHRNQNPTKAIDYFLEALKVAKSESAKRQIQRHLDEIIHSDR